MLRSLAVVSLLTSVAFAQSSSSSSTTDPLIPTGISAPCTSFLTQFDNDASIASCLAAVISATSAFAGASNGTPSSAAVTSALTSLASDSVSNSCNQTLIRGQIANFYTACPAELTTSANSNVIQIYDFLYVLLPFQQAATCKDDSGNFCALAPSTSTREVSDEVDQSPSLGLSELLSYLSFNAGGALKRRSADSAITPNITTFQNTNLPFLFITPDLDATKLCTTCTRNVITSYITFESNIPYAPGLSNSELLCNQTALYDAIQSKCPGNFLSGAVEAAGSLSSGSTLFSGAVPAISSEPRNLFALVMGLVTLALSSVAL